METCPVCHQLTLPTTDVRHATHVALGRAVCSTLCHQKAYEFSANIDGELPLEPIFYLVS